MTFEHTEKNKITDFSSIHIHCQHPSQVSVRDRYSGRKEQVKKKAGIYEMHKARSHQTLPILVKSRVDRLSSLVPYCLDAPLPLMLIFHPSDL